MTSHESNAITDPSASDQKPTRCHCGLYHDPAEHEALAAKHESITSNTSEDPSVCPLCGGPNDCAMSCGRSASNCWCMSAAVPQALLDAVPESARNKQCICSGCIEAYKATGRIRRFVP